MMISKCDAPLYIELMCDGDIRAFLQKEKDLKFTLEDAIDPLSQGIPVAIIAICHRARDSMSLVQLLIVCRAILYSPVRMMYQPLARLSRAQCHLHRLRNLLGLQILVHMPAHNLA